MRSGLGASQVQDTPNYLKKQDKNLTSLGTLIFLSNFLIALIN